jgi:hypothetical protein
VDGINVGESLVRRCPVRTNQRVGAFECQCPVKTKQRAYLNANVVNLYLELQDCEITAT